MKKLPPVGGEPEPAASKMPTSVIVRAPAAVIVPTQRILLFVCAPVTWESVPPVRASVVVVVEKRPVSATAAVPAPVPHWRKRKVFCARIAPEINCFPPEPPPTFTTTVAMIHHPFLFYAWMAQMWYNQHSNGRA